MDTPYLLKPREVAKAVRKAMAEGRLGYQRGHVLCKYDYGDGSGCAIGVALPTGLVREDEAQVSVVRLRNRGRVSVETEADLDLLSRLQITHDKMCSEDGTEAAFVEALEACESA